MARLRHELWSDGNGEQTFCLAGPMGDAARALLSADATLVWTVDADSHLDAMTRYYEFMGWGKYTTDQEWDRQPYADDWLTIQLTSSNNAV